MTCAEIFSLMGGNVNGMMRTTKLTPESHCKYYEVSNFTLTLVLNSSLLLYGPIRAEYTGNNLAPCRLGIFSTGIVFGAKIVTAQIFLRIYIHNFLSEFSRIENIDNRQYEI